MSFLESMQNRYTTKKYDPLRKIPAAQIEELKNILRLSPSSINSQPWKFTIISDNGTRKALSEVSWLNKEKVLNCDSVIVFSRINSIALFEQRIKEELPERAYNYYVEFIKPWSEDEIKAWFEKQVYLALGIFLSACAEMRIDSTPMEGIEPDKYDEILNQSDYSSIVAVAIGYRDVEDFNQPSKKPKSRRDLKDVIEII